jgi:hypothetical protein
MEWISVGLAVSVQNVGCGNETECIGSGGPAEPACSAHSTKKRGGISRLL